MKKINLIPPFKSFILQNFPFIEEDFDALTNYELLCHVVNYIKTMGNEFNNIVLNVEELENWFNNLDVQDEIDNKLDQMVEDGTLQEIISDYLNTKAIFAFDTVADMKEATNLIDGSYTRTLGYHELNDNGDSLYKIREIKNTDTVDEMLLIALSDENLIAELILNNTMNVEQFGAYGDNDHDDSVYIQKTIETCSNINLSNKTYLINDKLTINNKHDLTINGNGCEINFTGSGKQLFELKNTCTNIEIKNIECNGQADSNSTTSLQSFIANNSNSNNDFKNIKITNNIIHNLTNGISVNCDLAGNMENIEILNNIIYNIYKIEAGYGYGIHLADGSDHNVNGIIKNNDVSQCARHCIYIARGNNYTIENNFIHNNRSVEITNFAPALNLSRSKNINVYNNVFKNNYDCNIFCSSELNPDESYPLDSYMCENINIYNNKIEGYSTVNSLAIGYAESSTSHVKNIDISNNIFIDTNTMGIYSAEQININNNKFIPKHSNPCITIAGGTNETSTLYTHDLYLKNNIFEIIENNSRPIRLNSIFLNHDASITFNNNIVNYGKLIITQSNSSNNKIKIINQIFDNDFYFNSTYAFDPVYVNNVDITT